MHLPDSVFISYSPTTDGTAALLRGYSGISIAKDRVLAHGSVLAPLLSRSRKLSDFLAAMRPGQLIPILPSEQPIFDFAFFIHRDQMATKSGRLAAVWICPLLQSTLENSFKSWNFEKMEKLNRSLLSVFLMIECPSSSSESAAGASQRTFRRQIVDERKEEREGEGEGEGRVEWVAKIEESLFRLGKQAAIGRPIKGSTVEIVSTPFGNAFFADSVTRGIIGNLLGDEECLILMDATGLPGCEGGPVYLIDRRDRKSICGMVIATLSWCRGEWVDYTLAVNLLPSLKRILRNRALRDRNEPRSFVSTVLRCRAEKPLHRVDSLERSVVIVRCGPNWGTGILLNEQSGIFITCAHVVNKAFERRIELAAPRKGRTDWIALARLIYKTQDDKPYDIAVLKIDSNDRDPSMKAIKLADKPARRGERVLSIGFPFSSRSKATVSSGVVSKTSVSMLQTNCCAQSGSSGGPIVRRDTFEMLGIIVSNTVSSDGSILYPRLSMAVPVTVFKQSLDSYVQTTDPKMLQDLTERDANVEALWNLRPYLFSHI